MRGRAATEMRPAGAGAGFGSRADLQVDAVRSDRQRPWQPDYQRAKVDRARVGIGQGTLGGSRTTTTPGRTHLLLRVVYAEVGSRSGIRSWTRVTSSVTWGAGDCVR
jgi:hypothetical protein